MRQRPPKRAGLIGLPRPECADKHTAHTFQTFHDSFDPRAPPRTPSKRRAAGLLTLTVVRDVLARVVGQIGRLTMTISEPP